MVTDPCWQHRPLLDRYLNTHRVDARVVSAAGLAVEDGQDIQQGADLQRRQLAPLSAVGSEELRPVMHDGRSQLLGCQIVGA